MVLQRRAVVTGSVAPARRLPCLALILTKHEESAVDRLMSPAPARGRHAPAGAARAAWTYALITLGALAAAGVTTTAGAADLAPATGIDAQRAACQRAPYEDRRACLREIGAARQEAQRGRLADGGNASVYHRNALRRCEALPAADQADCRARIESGTTTGGVPQGGVLREYRQVIPASPAAVPSVPDPASGPASDAAGTPGTRS